MFKKLPPILKHIWHAFKALFGVALLLPILGYMVWFSYTVDRAGLFQGDQYEREIVEMLLNGEDVFGYEKMQERSLTKLIVQNFDKVPNTIALGSSRVMQITKKQADSESFFNFGMSGGDYKDVLTTYYLFEKLGSFPKNIIIGFDPWLLNDDGVDRRSDNELYREYCAFMGEDIAFEYKDQSAKWQELFSPSYFQGCVEYFYRDKSLYEHPIGIIGDINAQTTEIKRSDGSVLYTPEYRNAVADVIDFRALEQAGTFLRMQDYLQPSENLTKQFDKFLAHAKKQNINVIFFLPPYHHIVWDVVTKSQSVYPGFFKTETAVRALAAKHNVPVYGSYNPYALEELQHSDFYDGLHITSEGIEKIFPGIKKANADLKNNICPKVPPYDTAAMPNI